MYFSVNVLLFCAHPPSFPLSIFKRIHACACTLEMLRAHLNGGWTAIITPSISMQPVILVNQAFSPKALLFNHRNHRVFLFCSTQGCWITYLVVFFPLKHNMQNKPMTWIIKPNFLNSYFSSCFVLKQVRWQQQMLLCAGGCSWDTTKSSCVYSITAHRRGKAAAEMKNSPLPKPQVICW